ncbi:Zinc finger MYM-type protein 1 [Cyphomyrmex costatus]|uniref:Zinc finger MYM-type protein 1 n=1 Tax=Cyphomyrmex costatus TaxID=456900 RepID=A0A151IQ77_9HYME|nr:Zinc finger MYM-type protein 1 [Cyphomyrmex costatus]
MDETSDISRLEQISFSIRIVLEDLTVEEIFMGFFETNSTTADALFKIVKDIFTRYDLDIYKLRGQCYDGAANFSGRVTGLQARVQELEPRALYVHCNAHTLNLVVQDGMERIPTAKNCIGIVKELITFIRDSPKRLAQFKELQAENCPVLTQFCPTR